MASSLAARPLLRWDPFAITVDLDMVELALNRELTRRIPSLRRLEIAGDGDALELHLEAAWQGLPGQVTARLRELRLRRRFFGCRIEAVRGPLGLPLPVALVGALARRLGQGVLRFDGEDRILLADLRRFLPEGLEARVSDVVCEGRRLRVELAGGSVAAVLAGVPEAG